MPLAAGRAHRRREPDDALGQCAEGRADGPARALPARGDDARLRGLHGDARPAGGRAPFRCARRRRRSGAWERNELEYAPPRRDRRDGRGAGLARGDGCRTFGLRFHGDRHAGRHVRRLDAGGVPGTHTRGIKPPLRGFKCLRWGRRRCDVQNGRACRGDTKREGRACRVRSRWTVYGLPRMGEGN